MARPFCQENQAPIEKFTYQRHLLSTLLCLIVLLFGLSRIWVSILLFFEDLDGEICDTEQGNNYEDIHTGVIVQKLPNSEQRYDLDEPDHSHTQPPEPSSIVTSILPQISCQIHTYIWTHLVLPSLLVNDILHLLQLVEVYYQLASSLNGYVVNVIEVLHTVIRGV